MTPQKVLLVEGNDLDSHTNSLQSHSNAKGKGIVEDMASQEFTKRLNTLFNGKKFVKEGRCFSEGDCEMPPSSEDESEGHASLDSLEETGDSNKVLEEFLLEA